jgi:hypothetical protein
LARERLAELPQVDVVASGQARSSARARLRSSLIFVDFTGANARLTALWRTEADPNFAVSLRRDALVDRQRALRRKQQTSETRVGAVAPGDVRDVEDMRLPAMPTNFGMVDRTVIEADALP